MNLEHQLSSHSTFHRLFTWSECHTSMILETLNVNTAFACDSYWYTLVGTHG
jgi:hypothetical protein